MGQIAVHEIRVRPALPGDMRAVEDLLTKANLPVEGVKKAIGLFVVAENNGKVVGVAGVERCGDFGLLRSVAVDPAVKGRGVGAAMTEWLIADAEANGLHALYLLTTTADSYFPSFGFEKTARDTVPAEIKQSSEFRDICPSSATVMYRELQKKSNAAR